MGIGTRRDPLEANVWYVKAAAAGDDRAKIRIAAINAAASGGRPRQMDATTARNGKIKKAPSANDKVVQAEKTATTPITPTTALPAEKEKKAGKDEEKSAKDKDKDCIVM